MSLLTIKFWNGRKIQNGLHSIVYVTEIARPLKFEDKNVLLSSMLGHKFIKQNQYW